MNQAKHTMDRQKSEMEIEKQRKNDLIMYLAHDLKTPLASSISYLTLLRDEKQIGKKAQIHIQKDKEHRQHGQQKDRVHMTAKDPVIKVKGLGVAQRRWLIRSVTLRCCGTRSRFQKNCGRNTSRFPSRI